MQLRPYQLEAVDFLESRKRALLALPPGAGKTAIVASAIPNEGRCLIVAPNGPVLQHWRDELYTWAGAGSWLGTGTKTQRAKHRDEVRTFAHGILVLNYETFRRDIEQLLDIPWAAVVFDESHRLKNRQSLTFKAARRLKPEHLYLVTGTPVLNRADELWTSLHLMDPEHYRSYWRWVEDRFQIAYPRYRRRIVREVGSIKSSEHAQLIRKELKVRMFYRPLDEILPDLPEVTETYYGVELSDREQEAQRQMMEAFWMEVGDDIVHAPNHISRTTRLRQLCSDWSVFGEPPGTKAQVVANLVEELDGEPCVVFCSFRSTAEAVAGILDNACSYHGGMSAATREIVLRGFKSGAVKTLVATIATLGEGVDGLQHVAHTAIFLDRDWTPARNDQAVARLRRSGQRDSVNVIHVVADDSMDDVVATALREKRDVVGAIIETRDRDAVH